MSRFLAPIHGWLFSKIVILENIEKEILQSADTENVKKVHTNLVEQFGDFLPNQPLEDIIDKTNIHGWLQEKITVAESRQASFVSALMAENNDAIEAIVNIYNKMGKQVAETFEAKISSPNDALNALNNVLLEGMPCDRVNVILEQTEERVSWKTQNCVHTANWNSNGTDVSYYYRFREAFSAGFVETLRNDYTYTYENLNEQLHEITVK